MVGWLTGEDLVNLLMMLRTVDDRAFVILEGSADWQALDSHIDEAAAVTFPAHSKYAANRAIELADQRQLGNVLAILDRDWVGMLTTALDSPNVVYTDDYDLDATILQTGAVMEKILSSYTDRDVRSRDLTRMTLDAKGLVTKLAGEAGLMRFVSEEHDMGLRCGGLPIHRALTPAEDAIDLEKLTVIAVSRSPHCVVTEAVVIATVQQRRTHAGDLRPYCNGHDMSCVMAALIKRWGGNASQLAVERAARAAFSCADLQATRLYGAVIA